MIRRFGDDFLRRYADVVTPYQRRVLAELGACRHAELGGHVWRCDRCGAVQAAYNSCRNRHCPTCQGFAKERCSKPAAPSSCPCPISKS